MEESTLAKEWLTKEELRGEKRGELRGEHKSLLRVLRTRFGETVAEDIVARINQETDLETVERWIDLAATMPTIGDFQAAIRATATPNS